MIDSMTWLLVMNCLEKYFLTHGRTVAKYPTLIIILSILTTILCGFGLLSFHEEYDMTNLWAPKDSKFAKNVQWVRENFPQQLRQYNVMFKADNVLTPRVVQEMFKMSQKMRKVSFANKTWEDICFRVPIVATPSCLDFKQSQTKECKEFKMPNLTTNDIKILFPLFQTVKEEGFSPKIGCRPFVNINYLTSCFS